MATARAGAATPRSCALRGGAAELEHLSVDLSTPTKLDSVLRAAKPTSSIHRHIGLGLPLLQIWLSISISAHKGRGQGQADRFRHNLPPDIEALFTKNPAIKDVSEFALSDNGAYFISYRDHDGQLLYKHYNLPNALTSWLYCSQASIVRDLSSLSVSLGPYDSYYAWDRTSASWSNLPPKLENSILDRLESQDTWRTIWKANGQEAPSFVSLGADGAYWMRTVNGGGCWDLKCSTPPANPGATDGMAGLRGTNKFLEDSSDFNSIAALYLFPTTPNAYVLITTASKTFSNLLEFMWPDCYLTPAFVNATVAPFGNHFLSNITSASSQKGSPINGHVTAASGLFEKRSKANGFESPS
ncbi:hypothetical protein ACEQ8H_008467 [Pleosporales sp. CAS-2024a]